MIVKDLSYLPMGNPEEKDQKLTKSGKTDHQRSVETEGMSFFDRYLQAIEILMGEAPFDDRRYRICRLYRPDENQPSLSLNQQRSIFVDGGVGFNDEFYLREDLIPEGEKGLGARYIYEFDTNGKLVKEPTMHQVFTEIALSEMVTQSRNKGAVIYVNNQKKYVSDGDSWANPEPPVSLGSGREQIKG